MGRYQRHLQLPEVGPKGQARLLTARVLLVGVGGLGSPAALYLAAAGVGTLALVDHDRVELSNLQRQIAHTTARVGQPKTTSAGQAIRALNPDVRIIEYPERLDAANASRILTGSDVVLDCTDNLASRYALNEAAVAAGIPVVHASILRFEGQLTVCWPPQGPCYRCLYPVAPPPALAPVAGLLGVVPGVMGVLQAAEALKLLLGIGEPLICRLLVYDALDVSFDVLHVRRDPRCPTCGSTPASGDSRTAV
jgi:molybdopterin/thiamine biosynthesis adenylyltransferase